MNRYVPIPCELYGHYEMAILLRSPLRLCWRGRGDTIRVGAGIPVNIRTRHRGEFLLLRNLDRTPLAIRLDRILRAQPLKPTRAPA